MSKYICELCKKDFKQKSDYDKHQKKKTPCISIDLIQKSILNKETKSDNKTNLTTIFKYCLDVLRDNEHLTGDKALRTLTHLLDLRLLEPQFGKTIDIDNLEYYDFSHIEADLIDHHIKRLLTIARFSNLAEENESNIPTNMKYLWDDILSVHPKTKNIFLKNKGFDITNQSTYTKLINKLNSFDFELIEADILGEAYEEVIQDVMVGKTLGQFFTPHKVKQMMINLIDPQVKSNGQIETIFDLAMGTGGFLINSLRYLIKQSKIKNIELDWDFIRNEGLGGREAEPDTYQLAVSNMLISSGYMFDVLEKGDSIRDPITKKYDIVLANPPFGIVGLNYDEIMHNLRDEYLPIKTNSAVPLFLQAIIYQLKIGGRCAVVLPEGQELFSKNKILVSIREFLTKTCDLKEVIYLPAGTFTHTTIKTCVFYFLKRREGKDVLTTDIKMSKTTQKEISRGYKFTKTHQTTKINFYEYNLENNIKHELIDGGVSIDIIAKNNYSLNYAEYLKDTIDEEQYADSVIVKTLSDCCYFDIGGTPSRSNNDYYEDGTNLWVSVKELNGDYIYDTKEKITDLGIKKSSVKLFNKGTILFSFKLSIGKTAIVGNPLYSNEAIAGINSKNENILNNKYLYYYLTINDFSNLGSGMIGNGSLNKKSLGKIKIPIPPLSQQSEIVKYLDFIYEKCNKTSIEKINELQELNKSTFLMQKILGQNEIKTLGECCDIQQGNILTKNDMVDGLYNVIGGGKIIGTHNIKNRDGNEITLTRVGDININYMIDAYYLTDNGFSIKSAKLDILTKYIYYILKYNNTNLYNLYNGAAQKVISKTNLKTLKILIPSLSKQSELIAYLESNDNLIKQLEKEISNNKEQAKQFLSSIVKINNDNLNTENESETDIISDSETESEHEIIEQIIKTKTKKTKNKNA